MTATSQPASPDSPSPSETAGIGVDLSSEDQILVLDFGVKYELVPCQHFVKAASPVYNVNEFLGSNAGHDRGLTPANILR